MQSNKRYIQLQHDYRKGKKKVGCTHHVTAEITFPWLGAEIKETYFFNSCTEYSFFLL